MADVERASVLDCTKCGDELTKRKRPLCEGCVEECVDDACENVTVHCNLCGKEQAEIRGGCGSEGLANQVLDYAQRRKAIGFMTPEVFAAFELFADDLRVGDA